MSSRIEHDVLSALNSYQVATRAVRDVLSNADLSDSCINKSTRTSIMMLNLGLVPDSKFETIKDSIIKSLESDEDEA